MACSQRLIASVVLPGFNLSAEMANYLPMAMDPSLKEYAEWMISSPHGGGQLFVSKMAEFKAELDEAMERYGVTLPELFHQLAIE